VKKDKENPDQFIVRFKNMDKQQVKELRRELDDFCKAYFQRRLQGTLE
jgi:ribosomal protein L10